MNLVEYGTIIHRVSGKSNDLNKKNNENAQQNNKE